ncbi:MAG: DsbC family protein [Azoarcus sp.]|jgi:thiol:disulfide interchange protein DsbC|nr:DsbC family protein [Azoarcus sp.]
MKTKSFVPPLVILSLAAWFYFQYRIPEQSIFPEIDGTIDIAQLPLENAIKQVRGNGKIQLVSFEDPNCLYCAKLDRNLARLENLTLYTFLLPILSEDSVVKSRRIWCAPDRALAWNDWMLKRRLHSGPENCDTTALDMNLKLGEKIGIRSVPYLLEGDGEQEASTPPP